ncbi:hypothetical protein CMI45_00335 [Candidatus Pacearchaeota archaeon]|nr:hypothetical protein [Candidatus Pacearchaeota archaeon]|tara:strand:+ start:9628 stop:10341 length:714 start_codon:yes stop_codon:yes gene_type:complete
MKKEVRIVSLILILLLVIVFVPNIKAIEITDLGNQEDLKKVTDQIPKNSEETGEIASDFLKKEWLDVLSKTKSIGPVVKGYEKISPYTDPVGKVVIGEKPGLNWFFFLTLAIWVTLAIYIDKVLSTFSTFSDITSMVISFGMATVLSILGLTRFVAVTISGLLLLADTWWVKLIGIIIFITVLVLISIFSKKFEAIIRLWRIRRAKNKKEEQELLDRMRLRGYTDIVENYAEKISET